ncbi:MAG: hypothetical protein ACJ74Z_19725, partial [Bryobacteraceae bacterium]
MQGLGRRLNYDADRILFVDLDSVRLDGQLNALGQQHVNLAQSYTEATPSGRGIRIVFRAKIPEALREQLSRASSIKIVPKGSLVDFPDVEVQLFFRNSYMTVTGDRIGECAAVEERQGYLDFLLSLWPPAKSLPSKRRISSVVATGTQGVDCEPAAKPSNKARVIVERILSREGDLKRLFLAEDPREEHSAKDLALCNGLASLCDFDPALVDAVFRQSKLYRPTKWKRACRGST